MDEPLPAWALGLGLSFLRSHTRLFSQYKPFAHGAFSLPKEKDIAVAARSGELQSEVRGGTVVASALVRTARVGATRRDFAGRAVHIKRGDCIVRAIAGDCEGLPALLARLVAEVGTRPIWAEVFAEHGGAVQAVEKAGFVKCATKISASSDIKTLYLKNAEGAERVPDSLDLAEEETISGLGVLASPQLVAACLQEVQAYTPAWGMHYSTYNVRRSWTAVALQGFDDDPAFIVKPAEMSRAWKAAHPDRLGATCRPTRAAQLLPTVWRLAHALPGRVERVRLMRLSAHHGKLSRHADITDRYAGTQDGHIARFHIPLQSDPLCVFSAWTLTGARQMAHMQEGSLFYLDVRKPHAATNRGPADRIHLVVDCICTAETRGMIIEGWKSRTVHAW